MADLGRKELRQALNDAGKQWLIFKRAFLSEHRAWPLAGVDAMQALNKLLPNSCTDDMEVTPTLCPNKNCQSDRIEIHSRQQPTRSGVAVQGYVECFECGVRGPMTCGYSGASVADCTIKAKSQAVRLWNIFADTVRV